MNAKSVFKGSSCFSCNELRNKPIFWSLLMRPRSLTIIISNVGAGKAAKNELKAHADEWTR